MKFFAEMFNRKHNTIRTDIFNSFNSPLLNKKMALNHSQNYLPLRNQVLLTLATMYAVKNNYKDIYVGFHVEPVNSVYYDAMSSFLKEYNSLIKSQKLSVKVVAPLIELTQIESIIKTDVINLINKSFSCYESKTKKECGKCTHCIHKKQITEEVRNSN